MEKKKFIEVSLPKYLKIIDKVLEDDKGGFLKFEDLANYLKVEKVCEIVRSEARVFIIYEDSEE